MLSTTRTRLTLGAAAAAAVIGGLFVAAPANAATGDITLANSTFTAGDWGTGLDVSGSGFTADTTVTITVSYTDGGTVLGQQDVTADATGAFANEVFTPTASLPLPADGEDVVVNATSTDGDTSNTIMLDVRAPKGISANTTTISTEDLTNRDAGIRITAAGYTPGETVTLSTVYNGETLPAMTFEADRSGSVDAALFLAQGTAEAGQIEFTLTGESSGVANSITITVTGDDIVAGPGPLAPLPVPTPETTTTGKLPRVSG
ncbi:hypothetical protein ACFRFH_01030 [Leifsonia sp. NPDC056824]|uniref:hypothetical protein n=1 Tax=Leifsonia sp. NPDC056824 TaxID=3345953 RepID=UPI00367E4E29